jgi:hypothetical protein
MAKGRGAGRTADPHMKKTIDYVVMQISEEREREFRAVAGNKNNGGLVWQAGFRVDSSVFSRAY